MSNIKVLPNRPPYVEFEQRAEEDREGTISKGSIVLKDVDYAVIRACGSKDTVEKPALEWLSHIELQAQRGAYPREWAKFFREQYDEWKKGAEGTKVNGLHVRNWPSISKAQAEGLVAARILTVEDLAGANEDALRHIGIGSRALQERARAWLETAANNGAAEELAMLRQRTANQEQQIKDLQAQVGTLIAKIEDLSPEQTQEPRKRRA